MREPHSELSATDDLLKATQAVNEPLGGNSDAEIIAQNSFLMRIEVREIHRNAKIAGCCWAKVITHPRPKQRRRRRRQRVGHRQRAQHVQRLTQIYRTCPACLLQKRRNGRWIYPAPRVDIGVNCFGPESRVHGCSNT